MAKQYRKEGLGRIDGSISAREIFTPPHSPEQEQNLAKLVDLLRPLLIGAFQQNITLAIEENYQIQEGDFIQHIHNYINEYITYKVTYTIRFFIKAGNGIKISTSGYISVRAGEGLECDDGDLNIDLATDPGLQITGDKLEAKPYTAAGLDKDSNGLKIILSDDIETGSAGGSGGLSFDGTDGLRVDPEDFLYLG